MKSREEILQAAQQEHAQQKNGDERELAIRNSATYAGWVAAAVATLAFAILAAWKDLPWENMLAVLSVMQMAVYWTRYVKTREARYLRLALLLTLCSIYFTVQYVLILVH